MTRFLYPLAEGADNAGESKLGGFEVTPCRRSKTVSTGLDYEVYNFMTVALKNQKPPNLVANGPN